MYEEMSSVELDTEVSQDLGGRDDREVYQMTTRERSSVKSTSVDDTALREQRGDDGEWRREGTASEIT